MENGAQMRKQRPRDPGPFHIQRARRLIALVRIEAGELAIRRVDGYDANVKAKIAESANLAQYITVVDDGILADQISQPDGGWIHISGSRKLNSCMIAFIIYGRHLH